MKAEDGRCLPHTGLRRAGPEERLENQGQELWGGSGSPSLTAQEKGGSL